MLLRTADVGRLGPPLLGRTGVRVGEDSRSFFPCAGAEGGGRVMDDNSDDEEEVAGTEGTHVESWNII